jgi:MFS family permease
MRESTAREWRQGWGTLLSAFFCYGIAGSYPALLTLFISPLEGEFGWSRTAITAGLLGVAIICLVAMPFVGMMVDRWGSKRVGLPGMIIYCTGIVLLGTTSSSIWHWWALWLIVAIGALLTHSMIWISAVGKLFNASRGTALAVMMCGSGAIQAVHPLLVNWMMMNYGWRAGFMSFGMVSLVLALPLLLFLFHADDGRAAAARGAKRTLTGISPRDAFRSWTFYRIAIIALLMTGSIVTLTVHFMPMMTGLGIARIRVAEALPLVGLGAIVGRLATGALLDRFHGATVGTIGFLIPILGVSVVLFWGVDGMLIFVVAALLGLGLGIEIDIVAYISTRYFGLKHYGTIFGAIGGILTFSSGAGPMLGGAIFDLTGSYSLLLACTLGAFVISSMLVASLGSYPAYDADSDDAPPPGRGHSDRTAAMPDDLVQGRMNPAPSPIVRRDL